MSISIGLVVVVVYPLFIVVLDVNVRVINIAGGCLLNNVHNSRWAFGTNFEKLKKIVSCKIDPEFLAYYMQLCFLSKCWCRCELFGAVCGSECPMNIYNRKKSSRSYLVF